LDDAVQGREPPPVLLIWKVCPAGFVPPAVPLYVRLPGERLMDGGGVRLRVMAIVCGAPCDGVTVIWPLFAGAVNPARFTFAVMVEGAVPELADKVSHG
jgi:hypothetical protein